MNRHTSQHPHRRKTPAAHPTPEVADIHALSAREVVYKVAEVSRMLRCATSVMEKLVHLASSANGHLTLSHWLVLVHLSGMPTCKQTDLKLDTKIAAAYLSRLLDDLTREGLVRRHRSPQDRRQILLALTARGKDAASELLASLNHVSQPTQVNAIENLAASLEQFVSFAAAERWLDE
jgi:DNA-binding MarR family transcriptional regulator